MKFACTTFLIYFSISVQAALVGQWTFNNANDAVSSTVGTLAGTASLSGGQLNLTGSGGFDTNTVGGLGGTGSFTIVADFITSNTASDQTIFSYTPSNGSDGGGDIRLFVQANGNLRIEMSVGAGFEADLGSLNLNDGATHRVAAIFDSNLGDSFLDVDLYVDESLYNVTSGTDHAIDLGATVTVDNAVSFGYQLHVTGNRTFNGSMNFVEIHNTALSSAAIAAIPEPSSILLMLGGLGLAVLGIRRRK